MCVFFSGELTTRILQCMMPIIEPLGKTGRVLWNLSRRRLYRRMIRSQNCLRRIWCNELPRSVKNQLGLMTSQVFRVYRDIRFSTDPTPYKVRTSNPLPLMSRILMSSSHSSPPHGVCSPTKDCALLNPSVLVLIIGRSRTGRKGPYAGYYVQIAPAEKSFVGQSSFYCFNPLHCH